jgi:hypothetical protein
MDLLDLPRTALAQFGSLNAPFSACVEGGVEGGASVERFHGAAVCRCATAVATAVSAGRLAATAAVSQSPAMRPRWLTRGSRTCRTKWTTSTSGSTGSAASMSRCSAADRARAARARWPGRGRARPARRGWAAGCGSWSRPGTTRATCSHTSRLERTSGGSRAQAPSRRWSRARSRRRPLLGATREAIHSATRSLPSRRRPPTSAPARRTAHRRSQTTRTGGGSPPSHRRRSHQTQD